MTARAANVASVLNGTASSSSTSGLVTRRNAFSAMAGRSISKAIRTRKWTDQGGQEHDTTEVVVDRFRGELVLIDSNRASEGGGWGQPDEGLDDQVPF